MLEVKGLRKSFGDLLAVDDVSFTVPDGICYGLLGPNGAGKTTTLSMITGTIEADAGLATIDGTTISAKSPKSRSKIGYVPQELALFEEITSQDNLRFFAALNGLMGQASQTQIDKALEIVGLADRAKEPVRNFSGGMKRRLNIAVGLLHEPKLLILDEPTVGVDPQSRNAIFECLQLLQSMGMTILYTTHYMEEVEKLCQRVAVMDGGKVIAEDSLVGLKQLLPTKNEVTLTLHTPALSPPAWRFETRLTEDGLEVEIDQLDADLAEILGLAPAHGLVITGVRTRQATLEEVFLHVTGRTLRD